MKYIKIKNYIKPILEYFTYLFNKYNKKIIKFKFFRIYKLIMLERKSYGFMKTKKIARRKKFIMKRKKKLQIYKG
jgi:hypothetical protein